MGVFFIRLALLAGFVALLPARALCDVAPPPSPSPEESPLRSAPAPYFSAEEEVSPDYDGTAGSSTLINLRGQIPYAAGAARYVFRVRIPIVTSAPQTAITGTGDVALFDLAVSDTQSGRWLTGATVRLPSGQKDSLGTGKYSIGPAFGYESRRGSWVFGFFEQNFFSVIGPKSRPPVGQSKIEPTIAYVFPRGWTVGTSRMTFTYDWVRSAWTDVPLGVGVDKTFADALRRIDASFEIEKNLAGVKGAPGWTLRTAVKWTFR
ncbi:MAG: hypothetical protein ABI231_08585 [Candidatus Tumulicola sp.]